MGLATAEAFQKEGDTVFIADKQETAAGAAVARESGGKYFSTDVRDFAAAEKIVETIVTAKGRLDVLVNNAGISRDHLLWKMTEEEWDEVLAVNLKGAFNFLRAAVIVCLTAFSSISATGFAGTIGVVKIII